MANRLAAETSPYLQQHAENPVDWYPWGEDALKLAREQDKPILLSVGYSACHWCHVMAHESFEDAETAAEMNRLFVNIKVDREERPDLDGIYQTAHQMLTGRSGGWPLTVALTPLGAPFFAGTYFPKHARYGMPSFKELLRKIALAYRAHRGEIEKQNEALMAALAKTNPTGLVADTLNGAPVRAALDELAQAFDSTNGGLGGAPKFPHASELAFCLRRYALDGDGTAASIVKLTLTKMAEGGIYDHLAGGFCRYSTDAFWTIPHFEKMLYDNGPLLALYSDAWLATHEARYEAVVRETARWVMRDMQSPHGGYYSSLDADSEGKEGKHYVWTREEVRALLTPDEYSVAAPHFGLDTEPNFEGRCWHLRVTRSLDAIADSLIRPAERCAATLESARRKLLHAREQRVRPGRDEKVLTSWNALMIKGMARAARTFPGAEYLRSAFRAADFIRATLWRDRRLLATWKDGRAHLNAYLDDYAFLLDALLELLQTEFRPEDLEWAQSIAEVLLEHFEDKEEGGFFFVSHDHERLIHRAKIGPDHATPSGNGVAACALQRLGHVLGETRYLTAAERTLQLFFDRIETNPSAHASLIAALEEALSPPHMVVLRGPSDQVLAWQAALAREYRPQSLILGIPSQVEALPAVLRGSGGAAERVSATVCRGVSCLAPVFELDELERAIAATPARTVAHGEERSL